MGKADSVTLWLLFMWSAIIGVACLALGVMGGAWVPMIAFVAIIPVALGIAVRALRT